MREVGWRSCYALIAPFLAVENFKERERTRASAGSVRTTLFARRPTCDRCRRSAATVRVCIRVPGRILNFLSHHYAHRHSCQKQRRHVQDHLCTILQGSPPWPVVASCGQSLHECETNDPLFVSPKMALSRTIFEKNHKPLIGARRQDGIALTISGADLPLRDRSLLIHRVVGELERRDR